MATRGISSKQLLSSRQSGPGERVSTETLTASLTSETIKIGSPGSKISFQRTGTLEASITFSINGITYEGAVAVSSDVIASYTTHAVSYIHVARTAGEGKISFNILA